MEELKAKLEESIIDSELTLGILQKYNNGVYDHIKPVIPESFPPVDNRTVIDLQGDVYLEEPREKLETALRNYGLDPGHYLPSGSEPVVRLSEIDLKTIGKALMPLYSFGILNGGSATSYADKKKNRAFDGFLFDLLQPGFRILAESSAGKPKGLTPAFINPDGTVGPSFIELKMRALLLSGCPSLFQMTSFFNNDLIEQTYREYERSPYLKDLIEETGINICRVHTGIQPLLAAFTHSSMGKKKSLFTDKKGNLLPLPGGHGQCFITLKDIFIRLHREGKRFVSIGNVDNSGYTPDPVSLSLLALTGKQAGFDFSYKTSVDVKGGVLVRDSSGHLNCADIGVAIDNEEVARAEIRGEKILFNCATGLFNLDYLIANLDRITESLPMRFSDQDKDTGRYSQAEQVTWEVIGLLDDILIFAVDKYDRFLAAKTIMENLMTSGYDRKNPDYPPARAGAAEKLNSGLEKKLKTVYGLELINRRWQPVPAGRGNRKK